VKTKNVRDIFQKEHGKDEVFISISVNDPAKCIAGAPDSFVNIILVYCGVLHLIILFEWRNGFSI
jgi:hypothetical protein